MRPSAATTRACVILASFAAFSLHANSPETSHRSIPELAALDRFLGEWDVEIIVKPGPLVPAGVKARGFTENVWSTDRQSLRQTWSIQSPELKPLFSGRSDIVYDTRRKLYRNTTLVAKGATTASEGVLDEASGTLTWTSRDPATRSTTVSRTTALREGVETWSMVITDAQGRRVFECSGTNTRR